jgi:hypothetical protein
MHAQAKNEELAQRSAGSSAEELEAMQAEFEARLGAAERKARARVPSAAGIMPSACACMHA